MAENYLDKFKKLLAELFMFDQADLDFGIYRIMNAKRDEITRFLDNDLLPQVRTAIGELEQADRAALQTDLSKAIEQAKGVGIDPETAPRVKELRQTLANTANVEALESEIFADLYNFFRRYYDEGDFLSLRRYKEGVYAIPYEGEEVKLYWANYDQYYIKTAEYFRDYTFTVGNRRRVHFRLADADTEQNNNRPANGQDRRFILREAEPVTEENGELVIRFENRPDAQKRRQDELNADAARRIFEASSARNWLADIAAKAPTEKSPDRTVLHKRLTDYTARNTFDYFIHKDLGGFLRRELDFYVKNEIVHLDDIESEAAFRVDQYLAKVKAIRRIAHKIIDFLAQIENFEKKLWLKKKFVVETNYCITLDRVPEELYPEIAANDSQREEWTQLLAIDGIQRDLARATGYSAPLTTDFLKENRNLPLDTVHFSAEFRDRLLQSITDLDNALDGALFHSENFQALQLARSRLMEDVSCIYADPPYNSDAGPISYKNGYRHSSWISLIDARLSLAYDLLESAGVVCMTIDDYEIHHLRTLWDSLFPSSELLGVVPIKNNPAGRTGTVGFSVCHEYALFYGKTEDAEINRLEHTEAQKARYKERDEIGFFEWTNFRKHGGLNTFRDARPRQFYPIYVRDSQIRIPKMTWDDDSRQYTIHEPAGEGEEVLLPVDENGRERIWDFVVDTAIEYIPHFKVRKDSAGKTAIYRKWRISEEGILPKTWWDKSEYSAAEYGTNLLTKMFGVPHTFMFPKSLFAVADCLKVAGLRNDRSGRVLDFFAGSGTTAHAVIALNREDGGSRKYALIEAGDYFYTVIVPRIKKAIYSKDWQDGKPVSRDGVSHMFRYQRLESYEDTLSNLELSRTPDQGELLGRSAEFREDYILRYMLDVETTGSSSLLSSTRFDDPFQYTLNVSNGSAGETRLVHVDLVETFNWLLGLRIKHIDVIRGFRVVQGVSPKGEKILVIWRNTREKTNANLDDFFIKQGYNTRDMEFDVIYVNGDNNLENLKRSDETWKVRLIEEEFKRLMFDVQDV